MLRHIVLIRWKPEADEASRSAAREAIEALGAAVPEVRDLRCGPSVRQSPNGYDFGTVMDFDDHEAFARYLASDAHRAYASGPARAAVASLAVIQHVW